MRSPAYIMKQIHTREFLNDEWTGETENRYLYLTDLIL